MRHDRNAGVPERGGAVLGVYDAIRFSTTSFLSSR